MRPLSGDRGGAAKPSILINRRHFLMGLGASVFATGCSGVTATPRPTAIPRVGFILLNSTSDPVAVENLEAFRLGLRERGYVEGENVVVDLRSAEGKPERLATLADELVGMQPAVIVTPVIEIVERVRETSPATPVVILNIDPGRAGISDWGHPGGSVTGIGATSPDAVNAKRLQLLKETVPGIARVTVLYNPNSGGLTELHGVAPALGVRMQLIAVPSADDVDLALEAAIAGGAEALLVLLGAVAMPRRTEISEFALKRRLPSMLSGREFVEAGGLMSYYPARKAFFRRSAYYVDRILKGAHPGSLPVEAPSVGELLVNLCTAAQLGIAIPASVLAQAEVIRCAAR